MQARRSRVEANVRRDAFGGECVSKPLRRFRHQPAPLQLVVKIRHRTNGLLYQPMAVTRREVLKTFAATGIGALTGAGFYGFAYARHQLEITRADVPVTRLPAALAGLKVGLMTDLHRSIWVSHDDVTHALTALMVERRESIVLGGDDVTRQDREYVIPSAEALKPLSAPQGVYGILGNHDDDHDMPAALAKNGVQVLKDARTRLRIKNETVDLIGIRFGTRDRSKSAIWCAIQVRRQLCSRTLQVG